MTGKNLTAHKVNWIAGYTTSQGVLLDLDRTTLQETIYIAKKLMKKHSLEGYLIIESSDLNHQIVFNKKFYRKAWEKVLSIIFKLVWNYHYYQHQRMSSLTFWAILQACKGSCTLRVNGKAQKGHPKILMRIGQQNKIIKEYLEIYDTFNKNYLESGTVFIKGKRHSRLTYSPKYETFNKEKLHETTEQKCT